MTTDKTKVGRETEEPVNPVAPAPKTDAMSLFERAFEKAGSKKASVVRVVVDSMVLETR